MRTPKTLWRTTQLALMACLMMVHPLAGSGQAAGRSLAAWLSALQCVCEHCGTGAIDEPASCCSKPDPAPLPACEDRCGCDHADQLPLDDDAPLGTPRDGGGLDGARLGRALAAAAWLPAFTGAEAPSADLARQREDAFPPGRSERGGARAVAHGGLSARAVRGPASFLSFLCIARI